jgi:glycosyltransferase involved in cell wall biosynthesis
MSATLNVSLIGLIAGGHSGVPRYAVALARALDRVCVEFPELRLSLVTTAGGARAVDAAHIAVHDSRLRSRWADAGPARIGLEQILAASQRADLLHFFDLSGPLLAPRRPFVATIHDASAVLGLRGGAHTYKRHLWPWAIRHARRVVAVSAFAKQEAVQNLGASPQKIEVIHSGPGLIASAQNGHVPREEDLLLYVGNLTPSKNLPFLVRAFGQADVRARLVLVGRVYQGSSELQDQIQRSGARDQIEIVSDASDADLDRLYRSATALMLPSRYEGFGFTPLEAMSRGCPVLASDIPPVREVSGAGALLLPLDDEATWADAIRRVVTDRTLRDELRGRGARMVASYSWEETARRLCRLLLDAGRR